MPTVEVNGTSLYYERVGVGVPCIALHGGLGMDHTYLKDAFVPLTDVLDLIYVDQRGNGRSARPPLESITMQQLADDVRALADALGLDRFALLGHSFGGFVALEAATTYPERLTQLFLLDTSPGAFEPTEAELAERPDPASVTPSARAAMQRFFSRVPASDDDFRDLVPEIAPAYMHHGDPALITDAMSRAILDAATLVRGFEFLPRWSVADKLDRITCPTLVACGRYDLLTTPECAKRLATSIPGAELAWFEDSGHFPWLEEPDAFIGAVKGFVRRNA